MLKRINFDLANDLGNLLSRTVSMIEKYCDGNVPLATTRDEIDEDLISVAIGAQEKTSIKMEKFEFNNALDSIWEVVRRANKYIDEKMPWALAKDESRKAELDTVLRNLAETLRIISILIIPYMHTTADRMREQLGISDIPAIWEDTFEFYKLKDVRVNKGEALFPRLDIDKELKELENVKQDKVATKDKHK